jgi:hypothetical protein
MRPSTHIRWSIDELALAAIAEITIAYKLSNATIASTLFSELAKNT